MEILLQVSSPEVLIISKTPETQSIYFSIVKRPQVNYSIIENSSSVVFFTFENVPTEKLNLIANKMMQLLSSLSQQTVPIDMSRLLTVIRRHRAECLSHIENNPHFCIASMAIGDMLYGNTKQDVSQLWST